MKPSIHRGCVSRFVRPPVWEAAGTRGMSHTTHTARETEHSAAQLLPLPPSRSRRQVWMCLQGRGATEGGSRRQEWCFWLLLSQLENFLVAGSIRELWRLVAHPRGVASLRQPALAGTVVADLQQRSALKEKGTRWCILNSSNSTEEHISRTQYKALLFFRTLFTPGTASPLRQNRSQPSVSRHCSPLRASTLGLFWKTRLVWGSCSRQVCIQFP